MWNPTQAVNDADRLFKSATVSDTVICYCGVKACSSGYNYTFYEDVSMTMLCLVNHIIYEKFPILYLPWLCS